MSFLPEEPVRLIVRSSISCQCTLVTTVPLHTLPRVTSTTTGSLLSRRKLRTSVTQSLSPFVTTLSPDTYTGQSAIMEFNPETIIFCEFVSICNTRSVQKTRNLVICQNTLLRIITLSELPPTKAHNYPCTYTV